MCLGVIKNLCSLSWGGDRIDPGYFPFVPPPQYVMRPQLQSTCHCILNHYVKIWHVSSGEKGPRAQHPPPPPYFTPKNTRPVFFALIEPIFFILEKNGIFKHFSTRIHTSCEYSSQSAFFNTV